MPDNKNSQHENQGNMDSIEEICHATWEPVYRYIYYKVQNREEAEDITQETFVKALSYLNRGNVHPDKYIGFLKTVALNVLRDLWRKKKRRGPTVDIDVFQPVENAVPDLSEESTQRMIIENALIQLNKLNEEQRTVIELRIIKGFSTAETARIMNKKEVTIRVMQHRALQALANILKNK
ncbi:sigma-70 family RNA polymerase sigma factor [Neobacillus sp. MM2021_6]|uniref:RNA polymerase sigma factor n=1 Tax=Bacillaceae TaxID=186817 RepID=UPI00140877FC|nr:MULTISPECIES: sigma-70 family RNA polymerase sigma factor [Bacillaceae]MBO0962673.1 sigma-70 family RNA polymerase sigma factor [Neobacillus sp. MM2021_6]NHC21439.1 sigma-70 family RNA polymerase sigma factor [Bacillus sp. MM2020_4]